VIEPLVQPIESLAPLISGGGWKTANGTQVGIADAQIKRAGRPDVAVLVAPGAAAAMTTTSSSAAAPCLWTRSRVPGHVHAVVVNSGNANASTGQQGMNDAREMAATTATALGCSVEEVLVCSTGVIGVPLPMDRIVPAIQRAADSLTATGLDAAKTIMTTDLVPKEAAATVDGITVGGMTKGSGMIHPDMATMLAFLATDARVNAADLQSLLEPIVDRTFNAITVDGDMSTNDTVILQATGTGPRVEAGSQAWAALESALFSVCRHLARAIARDGEGANHLLTVIVEGSSPDRAQAAARAVARSSLVKTAIHGRDANWGRIIGALGAAGVPDLNQTDLDVAGIPVVRQGTPVPFDEAQAKEAMSADEVVLHVRLPGAGLARAWGCDLSADYVRINADYRS
jgi:glutamate N-acetyltransferase/amino-acid N-acetyltransferase